MHSSWKYRKGSDPRTIAKPWTVMGVEERTSRDIRHPKASTLPDGGLVDFDSGAKSRPDLHIRGLPRVSDYEDFAMPSTSAWFLSGRQSGGRDRPHSMVVDVVVLRHLTIVLWIKLTTNGLESSYVPHDELLRAPHTYISPSPACAWSPSGHPFS